MRVPPAKGDSHKSHTRLDQSCGQQTALAEIVFAVECPQLLRFMTDVKRFPGSLGRDHVKRFLTETGPGRLTGHPVF